MQEDDDLVDHVNKVKALTNQLVCLEVPERDEDIVMILLKNLPTSYKFLFIAL
jgi:gluconate kinase